MISGLYNSVIYTYRKTESLVNNIPTITDTLNLSVSGSVQTLSGTEFIVSDKTEATRMVRIFMDVADVVESDYIKVDNGSDYYDIILLDNNLRGHHMEITAKMRK